MVDNGKMGEMFRDMLGIKITQNEKTARDLLYDVIFFLLGQLKWVIQLKTYCTFKL